MSTLTTTSIISNSRFVNRKNYIPTTLHWYKTNSSNHSIKESITLEDLQKYYSLTKRMACQLLGISEYKMSQVYYKRFGIKKWPSRRMKAIESAKKFYLTIEKERKDKMTEKSLETLNKLIDNVDRVEKKFTKNANMTFHEIVSELEKEYE